jgi:hypothetical protein
VIDVASLAAHTDAIPQDYVNLTGLQPSPDGRRLFATDTNAAALRVLDPRSLRIQETIRLSAKSGGAAGVQGLATAPDGSAIYTANLVSKNLSVVQQVQMGTSLAAFAPAPAAAYEGLFLRHYLGEKPGGSVQGWSLSPDAFPFGPNIEPVRSKFITDEGYEKDWGTIVETGGNPNYVYIRGLNTTGTERLTRVYFYYTRGSLAMWPANWQSDNTTVNSEPRNWVDIKTPPNGRGVCDTPLNWTPPNLGPGTDHYCIIGWAVEGDNPQPPDFAKYSKFNSFDDLVSFIQAHHNMAWRNTVDVEVPPPNASYTTLLNIPEAGGSVYIQVQFLDLPEDGEFAMNVAGSDEKNSVRQPRVSLEKLAGGYSPKNNPLYFPAKWDTSVEMNYWQGKTPVTDKGRLKVTLLTPTGPALLSDIERAARRAGRPSPVRSYGGIPVMLVGEVEYKMLYGTKTSGAEGSK